MMPKQNPSLLAPRALLEAVWQRGLDAFFPPRCGGCQRFSSALFCERCAPRVRRLVGPSCAICGRLFDPLARSAEICADCRAAPPPYEKARAAWAFEGPPRELIHRFKYRKSFAFAPRIARALKYTSGARALLEDWEPQCIVPVPLHPSRGRARGFNQSALLARELAHEDLPALELLRRVRRTPPQVGLDEKARRANVRDAFAVDLKLWEKHGAKGTRILLLDDVFTTGSTLGECARVLIEAGAGDVAALTIARQQKPDEPRAATSPEQDANLWNLTNHL